jgi:hypothetical protein
MRIWLRNRRRHLVSSADFATISSVRACSCMGVF